jgi:hypothetical protein
MAFMHLCSTGALPNARTAAPLTVIKRIGHRAGAHRRGAARGG